MLSMMFSLNRPLDRMRWPSRRMRCNQYSRSSSFSRLSSSPCSQHRCSTTGTQSRTETRTSPRRRRTPRQPRMGSRCLTSWLRALNKALKSSTLPRCSTLLRCSLRRKHLRPLSHLRRSTLLNSNKDLNLPSPLKLPTLLSSNQLLSSSQLLNSSMLPSSIISLRYPSRPSLRCTRTEASVSITRTILTCRTTRTCQPSRQPQACRPCRPCRSWANPHSPTEGGWDTSTRRTGTTGQTRCRR